MIHKSKNFLCSESKIEGVKLIGRNVFRDKRGFFMETYHEDAFQHLGLPTHWHQDNLSFSQSGVLRGLHLQTKNPQGKLVSCLKGAIYDVWVDLRPESKTFKKWEALTLISDEAASIYLPPGLAHGFFTLSEFALVQYKCTTAFDAESDSGIFWNDPEIGIDWGFDSGLNPILSIKDQQLPTTAEYLAKLQ